MKLYQNIQRENRANAIKKIMHKTVVIQEIKLKEANEIIKKKMLKQ